MRTGIETVQTIKELLAEIVFNKTSKVSKISNESVLGGVLYGNAKLTQKALKDIAIVESNIFPDSATGIDLDIIAERQGVASRFGANRSSTVLKIFADYGTTYLADTHVFKSTSGIEFNLITNFTMTNLSGYDFVPVRSVSVGSQTNVNATSINKVSPQPIGNKYVINEYAAIYGSDIEGDEFLRKRIIEAPNYVASGTLNKLTQVFIKINPNVLRVVYTGITETGKSIMSIVTQNGALLTSDELNDIISKSNEYLSITEQRVIGNSIEGITLTNINYQYIDIDFRADLSSSIDSDTIRKNIQNSLSKYLDFRFWDYTKKVEWDNLLDIVKQTEGVTYVADESFLPRLDISISKDKMPRIRGFIMRNLQGNVIIDNNNNINPIFYQNSVATSFTATVLGTIG